MSWRVGRRVGRTIYDESDLLIGVMDTKWFAELVVLSVNYRDQIKEEARSFSEQIAIARAEREERIRKNDTAVRSVEERLAAERAKVDALRAKVEEMLTTINKAEMPHGMRCDFNDFPCSCGLDALRNSVVALLKETKSS